MNPPIWPRRSSAKAHTRETQLTLAQIESGCPRAWTAGQVCVGKLPCTHGLDSRMHVHGLDSRMHVHGSDSRNVPGPGLDWSHGPGQSNVPGTGHGQSNVPGTVEFARNDTSFACPQPTSPPPSGRNLHFSKAEAPRMNLDPLPPAFVRNVVSYFPNGRRWLADLPQCIAALAARWQLRTLRPVASLSFNFVALATESRHGREVVLKVSPDPSVIAAESAWLLHHAGDDVVGVLATSTDAYLMECLSPGLPLDPASLPEDRQTAREIAALINGLSRSPPPAKPGSAVPRRGTGFEWVRRLQPRLRRPWPCRCEARRCGEEGVVRPGDFPLATVPCPRRLAPRQRARVRARRRDTAANCHRPTRVGRRD